MEEIEGLYEGIERLQTYDYVTDSFNWVGVDVMGNTLHRIFDDSRDDLMPDMGAYAALADETVTVVTTDAPRLDQGSPKPLYCEVAASGGLFDIRDIGRNVFYLSKLNRATGDRQSGWYSQQSRQMCIPARGPVRGASGVRRGRHRERSSLRGGPDERVEALMWSCHVKYRSSTSSIVTDLVIIVVGIRMHRSCIGAH